MVNTVKPGLQQTAAAKAAFAREAVASLKAHGIDVLADLAKAYLAAEKPLPHQQRYLYTMLRYLERARIAEAMAAAGASEPSKPPEAAICEPSKLPAGQPSGIAAETVAESDETSIIRKPEAPAPGNRTPNWQHMSKRQRLARR
jgi:hypothetical protein